MATATKKQTSAKVKAKATPKSKPAMAKKPSAVKKSAMAAKKMQPAKPQPRRASATGPDAIALLRADHKLVSTLFADYAKARSPAKKQQIVTKICSELTVHAQIEEEIFYPAVKRALKDKELVPEATIEHATCKDLIAQVEGAMPDGEMFDAKIKVLSEYIKHHVKEEQDEMFPKAKASKLDMADLGAQMVERKAELMAQRTEPVIHPSDMSTQRPLYQPVPLRSDGAFHRQ